MATTYLNKTLGTPTNNKIWTWSAWVKRTTIGTYGVLFNAHNSRDCIRFRNNDKIQIFFSEVSSGDLETNAVYRDTNAFYHLVLAVDTTQATASNRVKFYVNGEQVTSWATETYPAQDYACKINSAIEHRIGKDFLYTEYFEGIMSHVHFCDGTQLAPTVFGETDATTGEWKIKTSPSFTLGTNGFTILKDGNTITDQSSNSNNWSLAGGTLTNTEDCPSNVLCTLNPLDRGDLTNNATLSNGNTYYDSDQSGYNMRLGTIGANKGKWYWEGKYISHNMHGNSSNIGLNMGFTGDLMPIGTTTSYVGKTTNSYQFTDAGNVYNNDSTTTYDSGATACNQINDIGGIALDLDNNKAYFHVNGTWWNSANPSSGTGGLSINAASTTETGFYHPAISDKSSIRSYVYAFNFGNGYFGTTAISSEGTNASGIGKFEYDVPTGFTALSTKGLNE